MIGLYVDDLGISQEAAACLEEHLEEGTAEEFFVARQGRGEDVPAELYEKLEDLYAECPSAATG